MRTALLSLWLLATSCSAVLHRNEDAQACPEYRQLRCMTAIHCSYDQKRGCKVCACEAAVVEGADGKPALPPQGQEK